MVNINSVGNKYYPPTGDRDIDALLFDPDFRKNYCLDCKFHKPRYVCLRCKATIINNGEFVDVQLFDRIFKRVEFGSKEK